MKTKDLQKLINFIADSGLAEVNLETSAFKLQVKRYADQVAAAPAIVQAAPAPIVQTEIKAQAVEAVVVKKEKPAVASAPSSANQVEVKSPMIGTFYRSASPDNPPFVQVGDRINKGDVVCIVEAMKLFNEIESEVSGTIVKIVAENASPVEYDQVLFLVEAD